MTTISILAVNIVGVWISRTLCYGRPAREGDGCEYCRDSQIWRVRQYRCDIILDSRFINLWGFWTSDVGVLGFRVSVWEAHHIVLTILDISFYYIHISLVHSCEITSMKSWTMTVQLWALYKRRLVSRASWKPLSKNTDLPSGKGVTIQVSICHTVYQKSN